MDKIPSLEITPEHIYLSRRKFMVGIAALATGAVLAACGQQETATPVEPPAGPPPQASKGTDELGDKLTSYESVTSYNNFYEFSMGKQAVAGAARNFKTSPWEVKVGGLVNKPKTFGLEELLKFEQEERIYRLRCVERWSMVIPWVGFPLSRLLQEVEPQNSAKFVRFETLLDPKQMPGQQTSMFGWPYAEGLRLDEAMNDLTLLATGLYGKPLPAQDGAPIRLVVPWKYGFKSCKSIVKIDLVDRMPRSFWMAAAPDEYGFYANVNPEVSHPRWAQDAEVRLGETGTRKTLFLNGYAEQVASLYQGMDLRKDF